MNPARDPSEIPGLLEEANKVLWQRGLMLAQSGQIQYLDNTAWLNHTDVYNTNNAVLNAMLNATNSMGNALELYFVQSLEEGDIYGVRCLEGVVIASAGNGRTIAHEALHDCGAEDIYTVENQEDANPVPGLISQKRLPSDWGGGYYSPGLMQRELVGRLIMRSKTNPHVPDTRRDLPTGTIFGWKHSAKSGSSPKALGHAGVGQQSILKTPGSH